MAVNDNVSLPEDVATGVALLANDTDVDNALDPSSIVITTNPVNGTVSLNTTTGVATYTSNLNFNGSDSFAYTVQDVSGATSNIATVSITITPVNDPPVAADDAVTTLEDTSVIIDVVSNDTDVDNALSASTVKVTSVPAHGKTSVNISTGEITYTPDADYNGSDSFEYTINDVGNATSNSAIVDVAITSVDDPPVAVADNGSLIQNTTLAIDVLSNDHDVDDAIDASSVVIVGSPLHGTVLINPVNGVITYQPETDYLGSDSFSYSVKDANGMSSNVVSVMLTVSPPNKPPVAVNDALDYNLVTPLTIDVLANDHDPDNDLSELTIVAVSTPTFGTVAIQSNQIVYQPVGEQSGTVIFTYTIQDPGGLTSTATVTVQYQYRSLRPSEGFSPNGDGNNDTWYITSIERYPGNSLHVFDRWGILVYKVKNYNNETVVWDGRANTGQQSGNLLDAGTYYYSLTLDENSQKLSGFIQIIR